MMRGYCTVKFLQTEGCSHGNKLHTGTASFIVLVTKWLTEVSGGKRIYFGPIFQRSQSKVLGLDDSEVTVEQKHHGTRVKWKEEDAVHFRIKGNQR